MRDIAPIIVKDYTCHVKIYLDMCALKRPFDDQSQGRISLETHAVVRILSALNSRVVVLCNSAALEYENGLNPNPTRKERISILLSGLGPARPATEATFNRALALKVTGLRDIDALHLAFAEIQKAEYFITCDDEILRKSSGIALRLKVANPVKFVEDLNI